jgi:hypothetical protein
MRRIGLIVFLTLLVSCAAGPEVVTTEDSVLFTAFTDEELAKGLPIGWKTHKGICREFREGALYEVVELEGKRVLHIKAYDSGSILLRMVGLEPRRYPFLSWRWKTSNILPQSREKEVGGDDYPAAVCIVYGKRFLFPYHIRSIIYVWGNNVALGERYTNPCDDRFKIIVVQSGEKDVNQWLSYKVNHHEDYVREFGAEPPGIIAVGVQTNSDRTHGKVETYYSDIILHRY